MEQVAASFIAPNSRLSSFERLEIYNRQYWFRILNALAEDFPALRSVIGGRSIRRDVGCLSQGTSEPLVHAAQSRIASCRMACTQPSLRRPARPPGRDVARIEWAFVEAFDAAEHEPLTLEQISTLDGESHLALQPHLQLSSLSIPSTNWF